MRSAVAGLWTGFWRWHGGLTWRRKLLFWGAVFIALIVVIGVATPGAEEEDAPAPTDATNEELPPEPERTPTPTTTSSPEPNTPTPQTSEPEATPTPLPAHVVVTGTHFIAYEGGLLSTEIKVHFVVRIENQGAVPAEVSSITYKMRDEYGALLEEGEVPHAYPRKLAPGAVGVIGRTVTADAAVHTGDIHDVAVEFDVERVERPDNLLEFVQADSPDVGEWAEVRVTGALRNPSSKGYDNPKIAVVLVDTEGNWVGYMTADLAVDEVPPGEVVRFVTETDLPALVLPPIAEVVVIGFDK